MNITRKLEIVEQSVRSISRADDADSGLRDAALKRIEAFCESERVAMQDRVQKAIDLQVQGAATKQ